MIKSILGPKFKLGQVVGTPGALEALEASNQSPAEFLDRHVRGDWGDAESRAICPPKSRFG